MLHTDLRYFLYPGLLVLFISCSGGKVVTDKSVKILPPEELYGKLFYDVQERQIFEDSKTFVDAIPLGNVDTIVKLYFNKGKLNNTDLRYFVLDNYEIPQNDINFISDSVSINNHIKQLWKTLKRPYDEKISGTLLPLPNPYIVPGGRFREIYYWDSYFTMLGLRVDGEKETIKHMVDNFTYLIETNGFIPNGNRSYYLGRSQPPFFANMVQILADTEGEQVYENYMPALEKEYLFWMNGEDCIDELEPTNRRVVRLKDGEILNRYWDDFDTPRPESYREDVITANKALKKYPELSRENVYRNLRAGAESGWDFSSRWLIKDMKGEYDLSTIRTTHIIPVDLNVLLFNVERTLAKGYKFNENLSKANYYKAKYLARRKAINKYLWSRQEGFYMDYNFILEAQTETLSLAGVYPLFFNLATEAQARSISAKLETIFLRPGGLVTTPYHTGEQWDAPNGWAPLQYMSIEGLKNYSYKDLADKIAKRWTSLNEKVYSQNYKMLEKYNVEDLSKKSGGGEYPTQDGFGWTNGVYQALTKD